MKKNISLSLILALIIIMGKTIVFGEENQSAQTSSENVPVIRIGKTPKTASGASPLILERDLVIGHNEDSADYLFEQIFAVKADDTGSIFVLDGKAQTVKMFQSNGKFAKRFGQTGQGPGEWQYPTGLQISPVQGIMVSSMGRLTFFNLQGEFKSQKNILLFDMNPLLDSQGSLLAISASRGAQGQLYTELKKFSPDFNSSAVIARQETKIVPDGAKQPAIPEHLFYAITPKDEIVWALSGRYEIHIVNKSGKILRKIVKDYQPIEVTDEEKKNIRKERGLPEGPWEYPQAYPPVHALTADDEGRIFIMTYKTDAENRRYFDVLDTQGNFIGEISMKAAPFAWKNGKMYCIKEEETGLQHLERYSVRWK